MPLGGVLDVAKLHADAAAVRLLHAVDDLLQRLVVGARDVDGDELPQQIVVAELVVRQLQLARPGGRSAERVEVGGEVAQEAVCRDERVYASAHAFATAVRPGVDGGLRDWRLCPSQVTAGPISAISSGAIPSAVRLVEVAPPARIDRLRIFLVLGEELFDEPLVDTGDDRHGRAG